LTCTHGNWPKSSRGVIEVIIGRVFVVFARFLATDVVTLLCKRLSDMNATPFLGVPSRCPARRVKILNP
jgi:hypothetical protein